MGGISNCFHICLCLGFNISNVRLSFWGKLGYQVYHEPSKMEIPGEAYYGSSCCYFNLDELGEKIKQKQEYILHSFFANLLGLQQEKDN